MSNDVKIDWPDPKKDTAEAMKSVKNVIAVASGKGGVGKSTVAANLAVALALEGYSVGLLDSDIYGPSAPLMFDLVNARPLGETDENGKTWILPEVRYGVKVMSIGFFIDPEKAILWRGPMASNALKQLFQDVKWGELDYLVLDLPPGTGDIHISLVQMLRVDKVVMVTTPQKVALADVRKAADMFNQEHTHVPIIGIVENMSYFTPQELPNNKYHIFGQGGGEILAKDLNLPLLAQIPIVQSVAEAGDNGKPAASEPNSIVGTIFAELVNKIVKG